MKNLLLCIHGFFLNIFYPKYCISCKREGAFLCKKCFESIKYNDVKILKPFIKDSPIQSLCIPCSYHNNQTLRKAVHLIKYTFYKDLTKDLAKLILNANKESPFPQNSHLIPIPLHKKRLKYRGFNQSEILANQIGKKLNLPVTNLLERVKNTKKQADLNREERIENVKNIFNLNSKILLPATTPLVIIDDICTTLSTMNEAAITLQKHGYKLLFGTAIARA